MTTWTSQRRPGQGWEYNQSGITYSGTVDSISNNNVYYNAVGQATSWTALTKS